MYIHICMNIYNLRPFLSRIIYSYNTFQILNSYSSYLIFVEIIHMTTGTIQLAFLITSLVPLNSNFTSWTNFSKIQLSWLWFSKILMPLPRKWQALFVLVHSNFSSFSRPYLLYYLSYSSFYWTPFALCWLGFEFARINRSRAINSVIDLVDHPFPLTLLIF